MNNVQWKLLCRVLWLILMRVWFFPNHNLMSEDATSVGKLLEAEFSEPPKEPEVRVIADKIGQEGGDGK